MHTETIRQWETAYRMDPGERNLHGLMLAFMRCGDKYFDLHEFENAKNAYEEAAEYAEKSEHMQTDIQIQRDLSDCYLKLGDACREQHESAASGTLYEKAMQLRKTVMDRTGTPEDRRVFCICCEKAAGIYDSQDRPEEARACLENSLTVRRQIVAEAPKEYDCRALATVYDCLGIHYQLIKDSRTANDYYKEGLRLCQQLVSISDSHHNRELLAYAYFNTAATSRQRSDRKYFFQKAYELIERLSAERPQMEKYRKQLAAIRVQLALRSMTDE